MQKRVIKETDSKADFWHHHVIARRKLANKKGYTNEEVC